MSDEENKVQDETAEESSNVETNDENTTATPGEAKAGDSEDEAEEADESEDSE